MLHRMKYEENELFSQCADKIEVRNYVKEKIGSEYLIPLITEYSSKIDKENITIPCVLKANHNSGPVYILKSKDDLTDHVIDDINSQLMIDYGIVHGEWWYSKIKPKLFTEELLLDNSGKVPEDYKFHIFSGNKDVKIFVQVDFDRFGDHQRAFYDENLELLPFGVLYKSNFKKIDKPKNWSKMCEIAKKLSEDFNYVRVDLYNLNGKIYFGELTFAHGAGSERFYPKKYDLVLGKCWG
ncbi:ATP-grasp fold amidoligase family protein [Providencia manganoxydans]|uniref:ATP-grasp fold amidoligase family protein n=1 Tax=Providencia manganoxydans TaxID=2923283 RepID=UPI0034DD8CD6